MNFLAIGYIGLIVHYYIPHFSSLEIVSSFSLVLKPLNFRRRHRKEVVQPSQADEKNYFACIQHAMALRKAKLQNFCDAQRSISVRPRV